MIPRYVQVSIQKYIRLSFSSGSFVSRLLWRYYVLVTAMIQNAEAAVLLKVSRKWMRNDNDWFEMTITAIDDM